MYNLEKYRVSVVEDLRCQASIVNGLVFPQVSELLNFSVSDLIFKKTAKYISKHFEILPKVKDGVIYIFKIENTFTKEEFLTFTSCSID